MKKGENEEKRQGSPAPPPAPAKAEAETEAKVSIAEEVIRAIAALAAAEVEGLERSRLEPHLSGGSVAERVVGIFGGRGKGVEVEVSDEAVKVDLKVSASYGQPLHELARRIQERVKQDIEEMTGLRVSEVNVHIQEIHLPSEVKAKVKIKEKEKGEEKEKGKGEGKGEGEGGGRREGGKT